MAGIDSDNLKQKKLILIVGEQKCGTTSLFDYLAAHPNVFPSNRKQTFFFMHESFQRINKAEVPITYSDDPNDFLKLFPGYEGREGYLLEATPDYLHTPQALERINAYRNVFEKIIILVVLRDPIQRFLSWFNFSKQQQTIKNSTTISDFYQMNRTVQESYVSFDSCFFALDTGRYEKNIPAFTEVFGPDVKVYSFEDMKSDPEQLMVKVSLALKLDPNFYRNYEFKPSNVTVSSRFTYLRWGYMKLRAIYLKALGEQTRYYLRPVTAVVRKVYHALNDKRNDSSRGRVNDEEVLARLKIDYQETYEFCEKSLNIRWGR